MGFNEKVVVRKWKNWVEILVVVYWKEIEFRV